MAQSALQFDSNAGVKSSMTIHTGRAPKAIFVHQLICSLQMAIVVAFVAFFLFHTIYTFFEIKGVFDITKQLATVFYGIDLRTIKRTLLSYEDELKKNGYVVLTDNELKEFYHVLITKSMSVSKPLGLASLVSGHSST